MLTNSLVGVWALAAAAVALLQPGIPSSGWLLAHLLLLGAASTAILIWSQHFADTLLRRPGTGGRAALGVRLGLHTVGAAVVIGGVLSRLWPVVLAGGIAVVVVAVLQGGSLARQLARALPSRFGPLVRYYVAASVALVVGVTLGVILARPDVAGDIRERGYLAHVGFNLLGWVGLTVIGTVILLWPTILHARISTAADAAGRRALPVLSAALVLLGLACLLDVRLGVTAALVVYLAGLGLVLVGVVQQALAAPPRTYAGWSMGAALAWFTGCVAALAVLVGVARSWGEAGTALDGLVLPFVVGFVAQIVAAALSHLLPVVLGGGPAVAKRTGRELDRAAAFRVIVLNVGLLLALLPVPELVRTALLLLVGAVLVSFVGLAVRAVLVARRGDSGPLPPAEPSGRSGMVVAAAGAILLAVAAGVALDPGAVGGPAAGHAVTPTGHTTTVQVAMKDMRFVPDRIRVPAGDRLVIDLTNEDDMVHDLTLGNGVASRLLEGGEHARVDAGIIGGDVAGWCSVDSHRQLGMVMTITTTGAAHPAPSPASGGSAAADVDLMKRPPASFAARDATLPPAPPGRQHTATFTVRDIDAAVAPGVHQLRWAYDGTAPGPTLRGHVGDTFVVTLKNDTTMGHSIDFHAGSLAPNAPMRTIGPGKQLTYRFTATRCGIWLYHCATMPMSEHIANGMFGAVIIDPPHLAPVDREYLLVQSELYLGPEGGSADVVKLRADEPDLVAFNGYADQYRYRPAAAPAGRRVRIWVLDAGPNRPTSFHVIGAQFDTTFLEGEYLLRDGGSAGTGGSQALALQPGQGGFVELTFPQPGDYPFVTHVMVDAERGASGVFHVTG